MAGVQELLDCMISSWYPRFQRVTFKTVILPLPQPVLDWLVSDGLHLPPDSQAFAKRSPLEEYATEDDYQEWTSEDEASEGSAAPPPPPELATLRQQLQAAIESLGGRVVPKLSWSCPKDAVWMSPSASLCCANAEEVLLLLRSSDRVAHDICHALQQAAGGAADGGADGGAEAGPSGGAAASAAAGGGGALATTGSEAAAAAGAGAAAGAARAAAGAAGGVAAAAVPAVQHCLALRRWHDLQPGREFRCFVRGGELVGASQRDVTHCYSFLRDERRELAAALQAFHARHIQGRFPHPHYTYDAYVAASGAVRLLDFNPLRGTTSPLLFSWHELLAPPQPGAAAAPGAAGTGADAATAAAAAPGAEEEAGAAAATGSGQAEHPCQGCHRSVEPAGAAGAPAAAAAAAEPSYLAQLRRVQALSLADRQQQRLEEPQSQQQQQPRGTDGAAVSDAEQQPAPAPASAPAAGAPAEGGLELELRIVEEAVPLRPHSLAYGLPFDFADASSGSALDRLMEQAGGAGGGAGELWQALAAAGSGARRGAGGGVN